MACDSTDSLQNERKSSTVHPLLGDLSFQAVEIEVNGHVASQNAPSGVSYGAHNAARRIQPEGRGWIAS